MPKGINITLNQKLELIRLYESGLTIKEAANYVGCSITACYNTIHGSGVKSRNNIVPEQQQVEMVRLYLSGFGLEKVGKMFGRSTQAVVGALKKAGIPPRRVGSTRTYYVDEGFFDW